MLNRMAPKDRDQRRKPTRREFEVGRRTDESARPSQRRVSPQRRDDSASTDPASHGEEPSAESYAPPPREDRAG